MDRHRLLLATANAGKAREFGSLLSELRVNIVTLRDLPDVVPAEETGASFTENAILKAAGCARQAGMAAIADDSGLEVEALGGRPGVVSARYGGLGSNFREKMAMLLGELDASGDKDRRARFVCVIAFADAAGRIVATAEGICAGTIAPQPLGKGGFGYDPIFIPEGFGDTFGRLDEHVKQQISHRARATAKIMRYLRGFFED